MQPWMWALPLVIVLAIVKAKVWMGPISDSVLKIIDHLATNDETNGTDNKTENS